MTRHGVMVKGQGNINFNLNTGSKADHVVVLDLLRNKVK